ncbi:MAG: hypothetical protein AB1758_27105, partial [Candidatus Eremiobacterota bacterium]
LDARLNQGGVLVMDSGRTSAAYSGHVSLFAVWEGRYALRASPQVFIAPDEYGGAQVRDVGLGWSDQGLCSEIRNVEVNAWSGTAFQPRSPFRTLGPVTLQLRLENGRYRGTVDNRSGWVLEDCVLLTRGHKPSQPFRLGAGCTPIDRGTRDRVEHPEGASDRSQLFASIGRPEPGAVWLAGWLTSSPEPVHLVQPSLRSDTTLVLVVGRL